MLSPDILIANVLSGAIEWPALLITYFAIGRKRLVFATCSLNCQPFDTRDFYTQNRKERDFGIFFRTFFNVECRIAFGLWIKVW